MFTKQQKEFLSKIHDMSRSQSLHNTFSDWLELAAITLHQLPYHSGDLPRDDAFESLEQQYMERIKPYSKEQLTVFAELLALTTVAHYGDYRDFLGEIAGEAELLSKRGGQFFTPYSVCRMMAKMSFGNVKQQVEEKGIITVCEPAVGAGALVIASAEEAASQGVNPCAHLQFDCTDIGRDAFNMAYVQLSALGLQAIVHHGNTLTLECWESRPTPQLRLFNQWLEARDREHKLVRAMRSVLTGAVPMESDSRVASVADRVPLSLPAADTLFDPEPFVAPKETKKRSRQQPDIVLDRQMDFFG